MHDDLTDAVELSSRRRRTLSANSVMSRSGLFGRHRDGDHRRRGGVELLHGRLQHRARQLRNDAVDAVAHFLRRDVRILLELERDDDLRDALGRGRAEGIDAADGVDRFLDLVGDLGLDLLGRGAGKARRDRDGRDVDVGKPVDAEPPEGEEADHRSESTSTQAKTGRLTQSAASHCMAYLADDAHAVDQLIDAAGRDALARLQAARDFDLRRRPPGRSSRCALRRDRWRPRRHAAVPATVRTAAAGTRMPAACRLLDVRGGEETRLQAAVGVRHDRLDRSARGSRPSPTARRSGPAGEGLALDRRRPRRSRRCRQRPPTRTVREPSARRATDRCASPRRPWCRA